MSDTIFIASFAFDLVCLYRDEPVSKLGLPIVHRNPETIQTHINYGNPALSDTILLLDGLFLNVDSSPPAISTRKGSSGIG